MKKHKRLAFGVVIVVLIGVVACVAFFLLRKETSRDSTNSKYKEVCLSETTENRYEDGSSILDGGNTSRLEEYLSSLRGVEGFDQSPACLYLDIVLAINTSNASRARASFDKLSTLNEAEREFTEGLSRQSIYSLSELKSRVEIIEKIAEQTMKNGELKPAREVAQ